MVGVERGLKSIKEAGPEQGRADGEKKQRTEGREKKHNLPRTREKVAEKVTGEAAGRRGGVGKAKPARAALFPLFFFYAGLSVVTFPDD